MTKLIFDTRAWCLNVFPELAKKFANEKNDSIEPLMVFHNKLDYSKYKNKVESDNLFNYYEIGRRKYSKNDIVDLESKYNLINLWHVVYFDRFLKEKEEKFIIEQISYYIYAWEQIFLKHKPRYILNETVTGLWNYIPYALAKHHNVEYLGFLFTKSTNKYFFTRDIYGTFAEMNQKFELLLRGSLSKNEREKAQEFAEDFKRNHSVPFYMKFTSSLPKIHNFFNIYRIVINLFKDIRTYINTKEDYKVDFRVNGYKRDFTRLLRILSFKLKGTFEKPDYNDKYVLFPLHYQPEASTDICAAYYVDQYNVIVNIVKSLPFGVSLYVKEHYAVLGSKEIGFYNKLKKLPNVKLIDPWVKISELINHSSAVTILTGTSGLEAIILKKPVIIFGHVFFDIYPQIHKVSNLEDLPKLVLSALNNFEIDEEIYLKYLYAYITSGYDGRLHGDNFSNEEIEMHYRNLKYEIKGN